MSYEIPFTMKQYSLKINPFATSDLRIAADWYAAQKKELDEDFLENIDKTLLRIQHNPQ